MKTLAYYKGAAISFRRAAKAAKNPEMRREWTRAAVHAQRRVDQIERRVLAS